MHIKQQISKNTCKIHIKDIRMIVGRCKRAKSSLLKWKGNKLFKFDKSIKNKKREVNARRHR